MLKLRSFNPHIVFFNIFQNRSTCDRIPVPEGFIEFKFDLQTTLVEEKEFMFKLIEERKTCSLLFILFSRLDEKREFIYYIFGTLQHMREYANKYFCSFEDFDKYMEKIDNLIGYKKQKNIYPSNKQKQL